MRFFLYSTTTCLKIAQNIRRYSMKIKLSVATQASQAVKALEDSAIPENIMKTVASCTSLSGAPPIHTLLLNPIRGNTSLRSNKPSRDQQLECLIKLKKDTVLTLADWEELKLYQNPNASYNRNEFSAKAFMQTYITRNSMKEIIQREEEERKELAKEKAKKAEENKNLAEYQMQKADEEVGVDKGSANTSAAASPSSAHLSSIRRKASPGSAGLQRGLFKPVQRRQSINLGSVNTSSTSIASQVTVQSHQNVPCTPSSQSRRDSVSHNMSRRASINQREAAEILGYPLHF